MRLQLRFAFPELSQDEAVGPLDVSAEPVENAPFLFPRGGRRPPCKGNDLLACVSRRVEHELDEDHGSSFRIVLTLGTTREIYASGIYRAVSWTRRSTRAADRHQPYRPAGDAQHPPPPLRPGRHQRARARPHAQVRAPDPAGHS